MPPLSPRPLSQSTPQPDLASSPASAGGKGEQLRRLQSAGFPVPAFGVVDAAVLDGFLARAGLREAIEAQLDGVTAETSDAAAAAIEQLITSADLDEPARAAITAAHEASGASAAHAATGAVAVRSSALDEDGAEHSFAGQGSSFLHVHGPGEVAQRVVECWASAWSSRSLTYRLLHGLPLAGIRTAVVVQAMVDSDVSGVLFTVNPVNGSADELLASAVYGLGEGLVSGQVDADTVTLSRATGAVLSTTLGGKNQRAQASAGGGIEFVDEPAERRAALALGTDALARLHRTGLAIEEHAGGPQDIEWAFAGGEFFVLQARPVTGWVPAPSGALRVWDNANIVENFGDVTAPLTYSFANHTYGRVYRNYCQVLGVPARLLSEMDPHTSRLLGSFDGRVYYNVLNWYMILALVPGSSIQRKVLAATAGVRETDEELAQAQRPFGHLPPRTERMVHRRTALGFTRRFLTAQRTIDAFMAEFDEVYRSFDSAALASLSAHEAWSTYEDFERRLLDRWGPTAVLDAIISLSVGVLYGLTQRWLPDAPEWLLWQAIKVDDTGLESALPVDRLKALAARVRGDAALNELLATTDAAALPGALSSSELPSAAWLLGELERYVEDFGDRAVNELKLEEPDLRDDPTIAWSMLQGAVASPAAASADATAAQDADAWLQGRLKGPRKAIYSAVRRKAQATLRSRERVRFARSRAFGMARRLLRAVGTDLARQGVLDAPEDVVLVRLDELRGVFGGTLDPRELRGLAALRRTELAEQRAMPSPPSRFFTHGTPALSVREPDLDPDAPADLGDGILRGRPSCPGVVVGVAHVVDTPRDVGGAILIAYRTDPGWVGALSSASALVIERGSPLTHVAVVARELGIPTVVQVAGVTERVRTGMQVRVDGGLGTVELLDDDPASADEVPA